jgi:hypothetical protein
MIRKVTNERIGKSFRCVVVEQRVVNCFLAYNPGLEVRNIGGLQLSVALSDHDVRFVQLPAVFVSTKCHAYAMANSGLDTTHNHKDTLDLPIPLFRRREC